MSENIKGVDVNKVIDWDFVNKEIRESSPETKIYIGVDSQRYQRSDEMWCAYSINIVLHINGANGGRCYEGITSERDFGNMDLRLMNEVHKCLEGYGKVKEAIGERYVELHLDLNSDPSHPSNRVVKQACGYVTGVTGFESTGKDARVKIKPHSWASSHVADRGCKKTAKYARKRRKKVSKKRKRL